MTRAQYDGDDIGFEVLCGPGAGKTFNDKKVQKQDITYPTKIEMRTRADYNAATLNVMKLAKYQEVKGESIYYYLTKTKVIKTNIAKRTIELSDKLTENASEIIKKILKEKN